MQHTSDSMIPGSTYSKEFPSVSPLTKFARIVRFMFCSIRTVGLTLNM